MQNIRESLEPTILNFIKGLDLIEHKYLDQTKEVEKQLSITKDNVVPCCKTCNYAKREMSGEEFRNWIGRVFFHFEIDTIGSRGILTK